MYMVLHRAKGEGSNFALPYIQICKTVAHSDIHVIIHVPYFLESFPPLNCSALVIWLESICHDQVQVSHLFRLNRLGAQCTYECGSVATLIVPALVLFPPSNCTHIIAHLEINSTHGKNSVYVTSVLEVIVGASVRLLFVCYRHMYMYAKCHTHSVVLTDNYGHTSNQHMESYCSSAI